MDFKNGLDQLNQIGILRVCEDLWHAPNGRLFTKSPQTQDKHYSLKLYPKTNSFYDFAGGKGGDIVAFVGYIKELTNLQALTLLMEHYSLEDGEADWKKEWERKTAEQERKSREQIFQRALKIEIEHLKKWETVYNLALGRAVFEPFSNLWVYALEELQKVEYQLDILCATDQKQYRRMKKNDERGLSSDYQQWRADVEKILKKKGIWEW